MSSAVEPAESLEMADGYTELSPCASALLTDLYQLTMLDAYLEHNIRDKAVFEFFVRRLPKCRSFLIAAGLEQLLDYLESVSFDDQEIQWLESTSRFSPQLLDYLGEFRFRGDVYAMPEGTVFFENEPLVRIEASLPEAQLIETRLINLIQFQSLVASKAARCILAAPGKTLVDFGLRRAHGAEAGLMAARAAYVAGFSGTSAVLANARYGVPMYGTMAHSFVQAYDSEVEAFEQFVRTYPSGAVLLIDTYDTLRGAQRVAELARRLRPDGISIKAVRLDSGNMIALAAQVRELLDKSECSDISIFCSGGLDEYALAEFSRSAAAVDGFGIGTRLDVSADAPYLDCVYKIEEYAGVPRRKHSAGKSTWPGRKQVFRTSGDDGRITRDVIALAHEPQQGRALLEPVMRDGARLTQPPTLAEIRTVAASGLASLPESMHDPAAETAYEVEISASLRALTLRADSETH